MTPFSPSCPSSPADAFGARNGLAYGLMGFPLAFAALPLYVILPNHYARTFGVPLATLGAVLLGARLFDAFIDPALGKLVDRLFARSAGAVLAFGAVAAMVLAAGFALLFFPPAMAPSALVLWATAMLMLTYAGYSALSVAHQSWAALLGGSELEQSRIVAWREGLALAGVLIASVMPSLAGLPVTTVVFVALLVAGMLWLRTATRPAASRGPRQHVSLALPFATPAFRRLLAVYLVNGIASAVPATLVLFFIRDRLQAPAYEALFLASYFAVGALSIPLWVRAVHRIGLERAWLASMGLAIAVFVWASALGAGDVAAFTVVCALSGFGLGADLTLPSAILAGVIQRAGHGAQSEGAYFGWWHFATKLNLALAAGIALPALSWFGYSPDSRSPQALAALTAAYCVLPCVLKLAAAALLYSLLIRPLRETR